MQDKNAILPRFFRELTEKSCLSNSDIFATQDGFFAANSSLSQILLTRGITTFPNHRDEERQCDRFFDDWYLYAVPGGADSVYSLFKMREQELDAAGKVPADADTPGVTVSFIAFDTKLLSQCLENPSHDNRKALNREIDRVVAAGKQIHHKSLKSYFVSAKAQGPYLIARLYAAKIASFAQNGAVAVPLHYAALCKQADFQSQRIPAFLEENNRSAGYTVCDHNAIFIQDANTLSLHETQAILATHTGNATFHSFAAEVRWHARFLVWFAKLPIPGMGSTPYASAIRADMSICDTEMQGFTPYYRLNNRLVRQQEKYHPENR